MRTIQTILIICISINFCKAQKPIDEKIKKPKIGNNTSINFIKVKSKIVDSLLIIHPEKTKTQYEKMMDIWEQQIKAFDKAGQEVWVYENEYYNGTKKILKVGDYNLAKLNASWNDKISSVLVPINLDITLYEHDNFLGISKTLQGFGIRVCQQCYNNNNEYIGYDYTSFSSLFFPSKSNDVKITLNDNCSSIKITLNSNYSR